MSSCALVVSCSVDISVILASESEVGTDFVKVGGVGRGRRGEAPAVGCADVMGGGISLSALAVDDNDEDEEDDDAVIRRLLGIGRWSS